MFNLNSAVDKYTSDSFNIFPYTSWKNQSNIIPANADLNDYTTPGTYICTSDAIARTLLNGISRFAHKLFVIKYLENNLMQIVFGSTIYYRYTYNTTGTYNWQRWNIINSGDEVLTVSNNFNADDLYTGIYTINTDRTITSLLTKYPHYYKWGSLSCNSVADFCYQIYIPDRLDLNDKAIYFRCYYEHEPEPNNPWRDWYALYFNDYSNKILNKNGYIIFRNGLILQWGEIIINSTNYGETTLSIQFPNIVPIVIVGCTNGMEVPPIFTSATSNDTRTKILLYSNGNVLAGYNYLVIGS